MEVMEVLKRLTPAQREAVYLFYLKDLTVAKIAEILDRPENTVKSDLHRGREQMRQYLEPSM
jgi:RNA polymerase sigma-70 factor (ECF subfamily)